MPLPPYINDDMIDAYNRGRLDGIEEAKEAEKSNPGELTAGLVGLILIVGIVCLTAIKLFG